MEGGGDRSQRPAGLPQVFRPARLVAWTGVKEDLRNNLGWEPHDLLMDWTHSWFK